MKHAKAIDPKKYLDLIDQFKKDKKYIIAQNALAQASILDVVTDPQSLEQHPFVFSNDIQNEALSVTNQAQSGRCWLFATYNTVRDHVVKKYKMKNFEFSQSYSAFWDKFERTNSFLNKVIKTSKQSLTEREVDELMMRGFGGDGGFFEYGVEIIKKYGAVPVEVMPDSVTAKQTHYINILLDRCLKIAASEIRNQHHNLAKQKQIKEQALKEVLTILTRCYGPIPTKFDFVYQTTVKKEKVTKCLSFESPQEFWNKFVQFDFDDYLDIINFNAKHVQFNQLYQLEDTKSIYEANDIVALNVAKPILKLAALSAIMDKQPIWFACQYGSAGDRRTGIFDFKAYDYDTLFGIEFNKNKVEMESVSQLISNHAMIFLGFNLNEKATKIKQAELVKNFSKLQKTPEQLFNALADSMVIDRWKVENSHGDKSGNKGFVMITDSWFNQFVSQVVVPKKSLKTFFEKYPLVDKTLATLLKKTNGYELLIEKGLQTKPKLLSKYEPFIDLNLKHNYQIKGN